LNYRLHLTAWWHPSPDKLLQVIVLSVGDAALTKGDESYYLKSVSTERETWARDIGLLHDYLEGHFPELRLAFSHFHDVPPELALAEVRRRLAVEAPSLAGSCGTDRDCATTWTVAVVVADAAAGRLIAAGGGNVPAAVRCGGDPGVPADSLFTTGLARVAELSTMPLRRRPSGRSAASWITSEAVSVRDNCGVTGE
jgi:hypothetical protein